MSAINLSMVVEVDTKQLEEMREKMDKTRCSTTRKIRKGELCYVQDAIKNKQAYREYW